MDQKEQIKGKIFNMKNHPLFKIYQDASREIKDVVTQFKQVIISIEVE